MVRNPKVFILEDDLSFATLLEVLLKEKGYQVETCEDPEVALKRVVDFSPDLIITDLRLPKMSGIEFIERVKALLPDTLFLVITAYATVSSAVEAMKKGAVDYITKPLGSPEEFLSLVQNLLFKKSQKETFEEEQEELPPLEILFLDIEDVYEKVIKVAPTDITVTLYGETGTGKSLIARVIHRLSKRPGRFVEVNCAAIPETLIESELFGYEKGAFTGALKTKPGKIETAKDGTLFLDEISEMNLTVQAKFLTFLQNKTFERLGGLAPIKANVRFITATNQDLVKLVKEGKFREDLFFRINVFPIEIKPLRERKEAILKIAEYIIQKLAQRLQKDPLPLSQRLKEFLLNYPFPGNIRELENLLERAFVMATGKEIDLDQPVIPLNITHKPLVEKDMSSKEVIDLRSLEKNAIIEALKKTKGNKKEAAKLLGISLRTLYYKIKEYNLKIEGE